MNTPKQLPHKLPIGGSYVNFGASQRRSLPVHRNLPYFMIDLMLKIEILHAVAHTCHRWSSGWESEICQNLFNSLRRIGGAQDSHPPAADAVKSAFARFQSIEDYILYPISNCVGACRQVPRRTNGWTASPADSQCKRSFGGPVALRECGAADSDFWILCSILRGLTVPRKSRPFRGSCEGNWERSGYTPPQTKRSAVHAKSGSPRNAPAMGGGLEGRPRQSRIFRIASGGWIAHRIRIRPKHPCATLIRINRDDASVPGEIAAKAIRFQEDIAQLMPALVS